MSFSKLSSKTHLLSSLKNTPSIFTISHLFLNPTPNVQPITPTIHKNAILSSQIRSFTNSNIGFPSKSLISRNYNITPSSYSSQFALFRRNYSYVSNTVSMSSQDKKSKKTFWKLMGLVFGMVGLTYASVPLYRTFCQVTGYGGTIQRRETVEEKIVRHAQDGTTPTRELVVQFNADVADGMQWKFKPTQREVRVKPGESALAFYTAENCSSIPITGVSSYNVTPMKAGKYFNKIQCFCFEEQCLLPGEQIDMPVFFYVDPEIETDPTMDGVNNLILSYTFFKVNDKK